MRNHLFNVAEAVQRGLLPGGVDRRAAVCSEEPRGALRSAPRTTERATAGGSSVRPKLLTTLVLIWLIRTYANLGGHRIPIPVARTVSLTTKSRVTWKESHESLCP